MAILQVYGLEKHALNSVSVDAGQRLTLPDVAGTSTRSFDGRGFAAETVYDRLRRPSHIYVTAPGGARILAERIVYGEAAAAGGSANNLRGRKVLHYDSAGELFQPSYVFKGNLTTATRRLAVTFQQTPDWSALADLAEPAAMQAAAQPLLEADSALATNTFTTSTVFDALNRATRVTAPDKSIVVPAYDPANRLARLEINLRGGLSSTPFVTRIDYNARGQRVRTDHGNGASTVYVYDPLTFLLSRQTTTRASDGAKLQDFSPTYDPAHNIVEIDDDATASLFFRGTTPVAGGGQYDVLATRDLSARERDGTRAPRPAAGRSE